MDGPVSLLCSRNARSQKTLVGRAQWETHPAHPGDDVQEQAWKDYLELLTAALLGTRRVSARQGWVGEKVSLFEHPAGAVRIVPCRLLRRRATYVVKVFH
jgi:hypothetical protein